jgi:hypothetical protein
MSSNKKENNQWVQYVQFFREMNPELNHKQALKEAKESYQVLKKVYKQNGGFSNIDLQNPQLRYEAGVTALNSGLADIGRPIKFD